MNKQEVLAAKLLELRRLQKYSFGNYYKSIEDEIYKIKHDASIDYQTKTDHNYIKWAAWYTPLIVTQTIFLIFWLATLFCLYKIFRAKFLYKYLWVFFLTSLTGWFLFISYKERNLNLAVVKSDTQLRLGPSDRYMTRKNLKAVDEVIISNKEGSWYKVSTDSIMGWVHENDLELVNNNEL